jgi:hypothetical protein
MFTCSIGVPSGGGGLRKAAYPLEALCSIVSQRFGNSTGDMLLQVFFSSWCERTYQALGSISSGLGSSYPQLARFARR